MTSTQAIRMSYARGVPAPTEATARIRMAEFDQWLRRYKIHIARVVTDEIGHAMRDGVDDPIVMAERIQRAVETHA